MNARTLRDGLRDGAWTATVKAPPSPPAEWAAWRQARMAVAIRAAWMFLYQAKSFEEINAEFVKKRVLEREVTKARIGQYVDRGAEFLIERGAFVQV